MGLEKENWLLHWNKFWEEYVFIIECVRGSTILKDTLQFSEDHIKTETFWYLLLNELEKYFPRLCSRMIIEWEPFYILETI